MAPDTVVDTLGMFDATASLPEQVMQAAELATQVEAELPHHDDIENVVVLGMGDSGVAGDLLREVAGPFMAVPVVVHKGYGIPSFVGDGSLVFAVSFTGDTEETLEAAAQAAAAGGHLVTISQGGELAESAGGWGAAHIEVSTGIPMPRTALGALGVPPLVVLERTGLFPGATAWIDAAVEQLRRRRDELVADANPARQLARRIGRQWPLVYGGGGLGGLAAQRWKSQCNENAKVPAFANQIPELSHNELSGWGQHGDVSRQILRLVMLRHDFEHPQVALHIEVVSELVDEVVAAVEVVEAAGEGALAQLLDLMIVGDFTSLYLAAEAGVDPGPVPALDAVTDRLSRP